LRGYQRAWLRWDILAGLTVAAYLVPQVMAYGVLAGLPPVAGLWAAIPSLALYAFIGSSRQLSVGPESTCAIMTAVVVAPLAAGNPGRYAELAAALAVLVGLLAVVGWLLRLGFVGDLLSAPILVGYLAGIAVIMIVGQLGKVTGVHVTGTSVLGELKSFLTQLGMISWDTVLLSVVTLTFLFVVAWRWPRLPGPLLAVLAVTGITALFHLQEHGVAVVGKLSAGFPPLGLPPLGDYSTLLLPALGVLLVGYTDNVLTGRAFAIRGGYEIDANQEFLALGAANVGAGIFRGMPVSSSGSRTAIGESAGSRTQLHSLVVVACIIVVLLFLRPVLAVFPVAALGAIVIYAATRLVDLAEFRRLARYRRSELVLSLVTLLSVLVFDILKGIVVAVLISGAETLRRIARPNDAVQGHVEGVARHARHRRLPGRDDDPRAAGVPVRRAAVLRQRPRLPQAGACRSRRARRRTALVRAERRGERRHRHHRDGRRRGGPRQARRPGRGVRLRPGQARHPRPAADLRARGPGRSRPAVPDAADRGGRLPRLGARTGRRPAPPPASRRPAGHPG
jgi:high affinity sulfate transporter 1